MAQGLKAVQMQVPSTIGGGRAASHASRVASFGDSPVEELNPKLGTAFDDAFYLLQDFGRGESPTRREHSHHQAIGMFRATSQSFAAFIEFEGGTNQAGIADADGGAHGAAGLLSRAIVAYETNARVVNGGEPALGTSLSLTL